MRYIFLFAVPLLFLAGCATPIPPNTAVLTIDSVPPGATIATGGKDLGVTPNNITYTLPKGKTFPQTTPQITLTWVSGATLNTSLRVDGGGTTYYYRLQRPANAPNLQADIQYSSYLSQKQQPQPSGSDDGTYELGRSLGCLLGGGCSTSNHSESTKNSSPPSSIKCETRTSVYGTIYTNCN